MVSERRTGHGDTDEITPGSRKTRFISGSSSWSAGSTMAGGEYTEPRRADPSPETNDAASLLRSFFVDRPRSKWEEIQSLPRLSDEPLRAEDLRAEPTPPPSPAIAYTDVRVPAVISLVAPQSRLHRRFVRALRLSLLFVSIVILAVGLALMTWTLLMPPRPTEVPAVEIVALVAVIPLGV